MSADPFAHHPELRDKISDPMESFFRKSTLQQIVNALKERNLPVDWLHSDAEREASRNEALAGRRDRDIWIFAYASLMWDPSIRFEEVRRVRVPDHSREFILKDINGGRGTKERPGLMAALDKGSGCDGLVFRIARELIDEETEVLWRREKFGPAYTPEFVTAIGDDFEVQALTFVADHTAHLIDASLTRAQQVEYCATGTGFLGTSLEYLRNIAGHFEALGIEDEEVTGLLREAEAFAAAHNPGS